MRELTQRETTSVGGAGTVGVVELLAGDLLLQAASKLGGTPSLQNAVRQHGQALHDQGVADGGDPQSGGGAPGPSGPGPKHDVWECVKFHSCEQ